MSDMNATDPYAGERLKLSPFYPRAEALNIRNAWRSWNGYKFAEYYYDAEYEYFCVRNTCATYDICPMQKYAIRGRDAEAMLNRMVTRDVKKIGLDRVAYCVWCTDEGRMIDDGTIFKYSDDNFMLTCGSPCTAWLEKSAFGFDDVTVTDVTDDIAALSFQGPTTCAVLKNMGLSGIETLKPFGIMRFPFHGDTLTVSRTGFTGDLGYELWMPPELAEALWDRLMTAGQDFGIRPFGTEALNIARIEAGFIQAGVDFVPAQDVIRTERCRSPYELGLGWLVHLKKDHFNGRSTLLTERAKGSRHNMVKLLVDGNKPAHNSFIFDRHDKLLGTVTSAIWSPTTKSNLALASLSTPWGQPGDELLAEIYYIRELKWTRVMERCRVVEDAFFDPERRHVTPAWDF